MPILHFNKDKELDPDKHMEHHIFIQDEIDDKQKADDIKHKALSTIIVAGILSVFSALGSVIWYAINDYIQRGGK